jgi:caa(3)-type oxidase subunit IV
MLEPQSAPARPAARPNYLAVLIVLVAFTALEVAASYLPVPAVRVPILLVLAATKAALVILFFMHLKVDSRRFAVWFGLGALLIVPLLVYLSFFMPLK